jgi:GntR family transcriptional regulator
VVLEHSWFPARILPGLLKHPLDGSLYDLLDSAYDRRPTRADEALEPVVARPRDAALLEVALGSPLMQVERTAYDRGGTPVEFARDLFRGDRSRFVLRSSLVR